MNWSKSTSSRIILLVVTASFFAVLFQNCEKKSDVSNIIQPQPQPKSTATPLKISIHTGSGLGTPIATGDLNPEDTYYVQVENLNFSGYACAEVVGVNTGKCRTGAGAALQIDQTKWTLIGSNTIEARIIPGELAFGETVVLYVKKTSEDTPTGFQYRVKSPSELSNPANVYIWHSSDDKGINRIRSIDAGKAFYSNVINASSNGTDVQICVQMIGGSLAEPACFNSSGARTNAWISSPLTSFDYKLKTNSGAGTVDRYYNVNPATWIPTDANCYMVYALKNNKTYASPLNLNGRACP